MYLTLSCFEFRCVVRYFCRGRFVITHGTIVPHSFMQGLHMSGATTLMSGFIITLITTIPYSMSHESWVLIWSSPEEDLPCLISTPYTTNKTYLLSCLQCAGATTWHRLMPPPGNQSGESSELTCRECGRQRSQLPATFTATRLCLCQHHSHISYKCWHFIHCHSPSQVFTFTCLC